MKLRSLAGIVGGTALLAVYGTAQTSLSIDESKTLIVEVKRGEPEKWGAINFTAPKGYEFCYFTAHNDLAREVRTNAVFHIVNASSRYLDFEWTVSNADPSSTPGSLQGDINVRWIRSTATADQRTKAFCEKLPASELPWHNAPMPSNAPAPSNPPPKLLVQSPIQTFDEFRGWNDGYAERKLKFQAPEGYDVCNLGVTVSTRNPRDEPPYASAAGYALIEASSKHVVWQAWVEQDGHLWGPGRWMHVEFGVLWISQSATLQEQVDSRCLTTLPPTRPVHELPPQIDERERQKGGPAPNPTPSIRYWTVDRYICRDRYNGKEDMYHDLAQGSNLSCQAARSELEKLENSRDLCQYPTDGSQDNIHRFSRKARISTSSCP